MPLLLVITMAVGVVLVVVPESSSPSAVPATVRLVTPLLSIRRAPEALLARRTEAKVRTSLDRIVTDPALASVAADGCVVVQVGARTLFAARPDAPVIPASALKLLTAEAALAVLGPDTRLATVLKADAAPVGGVIEGDLQIEGGGDPIILTDAEAAQAPRQPVVRTRMEDIAQAVVAAGVRQITGGIRADESRYDTERARPGWKSTYQSSGQVGPLSALLVDDGQDPVGQAVAQPALRFAQVLTDLLRPLGVQIAGAPSVGAASGKATVATQASLPVRDLVAQMVRESDNTTAELLLKEMGRVGGGVGTTQAGLAAARAALVAKGLDVAALDAQDGSGLDRADRATCALLLAALVGAGRASQLAESLPVAGRSGTLAKRFVGSSVAGRLRAKTGSLDGVSALVGWVDPAAGSTAPQVAFAVVANNVPARADPTRLADRVGLTLGAWPDSPPASAIDPVSPSAGP